MYQGFEIIDFHVHFPTQRPWFPKMGNTMQKYIEKVGEERARKVQEMSRPYGDADHSLVHDERPMELARRVCPILGHCLPRRHHRRRHLSHALVLRQRAQRTAGCRPYGTV